MPAFAQQTPQQLAEAELPSLLTIYKDIHTHPELSTQEQRTSALLAKELKSIGCDDTTGSRIIVETRVQTSPPFVDRYTPVPAPEVFGELVSPVPT